MIGGGYAGLAAAVELAERGIAVTVYEAARQLGGRARRVERHGTTLDNGQHILIGAYVETLSLMRRVGVPDASLMRLPLQWRFPPHFALDAARAPAPWHLAIGLLRARGMSLSARARCAMFLHRCRTLRFRLARDCTVASLLAEWGQDAAAIRFLWEPLCLAALNTAPEEASAQVFLNVLRDGLAAGRAASEVLLPATDLTRLFPDPAADYVTARGGEIRLGCAVRQIEREGEGFSVGTADGRRDHDAVIVATAPGHVSGLVGHFAPLAGAVEAIDRLEHRAIVTVYLHYPQRLRLAGPMLGLVGGCGQWLFDRDRIGSQPGLVAVVISAAGRDGRVPRETLAQRVHEEIAPLLGVACAPDWSQVIEEKRATFACVPDAVRPAQRTEVPGLYLAGDYTASDYPATLEAAVRSGLACARMACERLRS